MTEVVVVPPAAAPVAAVAPAGYGGFGGIPFSIPLPGFGGPGCGYAGGAATTGDVATLTAISNATADGLRETAAAARDSSRNDVEIAGKFADLAISNKDSTIFALGQAHRADVAAITRFAEAQKAIFEVDSKNADRFARLQETMDQRHVEALREKAENYRLQIDNLQDARRADRQEALLQKILDRLSDK
jgi:hypothetical protein